MTEKPTSPQQAVRQAFKIEPGSREHFWLLMAPYHLQMVTGKDAENLQSFARDVWNAALAPLAVSEPPAGVAVAAPGDFSDDDLWRFWWARPAVKDGEPDDMEAEFVAAVRRIIAAERTRSERATARLATPTHQAAEPAPSEFDPSLGKASEAKGEPQTSPTAHAAAPLQLAQQAHPDTVRLDWLEGARATAEAWMARDGRKGWRVTVYDHRDGSWGHSELAWGLTPRDAIDAAMSIPAPKSDASSGRVDQVGGPST